MPFSFLEIPQSRIATFDVMSISLEKHHIVALLEFDVTESRKKLREMRRNGIQISFNAWLIKAIASTLKMHPEACSYLYNKKKLIVFDTINISIVIEKEFEGKKVPIPLVVEKVNERNLEEISVEIERAKSLKFTKGEMVLAKESKRWEIFYYFLPGILRRMIWRIMLNYPKLAFRKMGNVSITSLGSAGRINGWFIHKTVHPISFGVGSIIRKPVVVNNEIKAREMLNMTILIDHDVIDGAPMVRLLNDLTKEIEGKS